MDGKEIGHVFHGKQFFHNRQFHCAPKVCSHKNTNKPHHAFATYKGKTADHFRIFTENSLQPNKHKSKKKIICDSYLYYILSYTIK